MALDCPKKYYWRYVMELAGIAPKATALYFGGLIHDELFYWHMHRKSRPIDDPLADSMMFGYRNQYPEEDFTVLGLELEIEGPIINPITCEKSADFAFRGKTDGLVDHSGSLFVMENKTASIMKNYVEKLWADRQSLHYCNYVEWTLQHPVRGVLYNVLVKPTANVKNIAAWYDKEPRFLREYLYFGPDDYDRASLTLWQIAQMIQRCTDTNQWIQNTKNCYAYNHPCEYLQICKSNDNPEVIDTHYEHKAAHEELTPDQETNDLV